MEFYKPPVLYNEQGQERTAGFELEFANVDIKQSVQIIRDLYGGEEHSINRFFKKVINTRLGDFTINIDLSILSRQSYQKLFNKLPVNLGEVQLGESNLEHEVESVLESLVSTIIPYEIGTPPVPVTEVHQFESLRLALHRHHAEGTKSFLTNAFATHINVEVPSTQAGAILHYLQAFLLMYPWLLEKCETDLARRVTAFINPFPGSYIEKVLQQHYAPDLHMLIEDYHQYNPDRNRPLDLYPLFAALHKDQVDTFHDLGKVKARKTFHYRLPNSQIDKADWSLAQEWNYWIRIEKLANDPDKLQQLGRDYLKLRKETLIGFESKWIKQLEQWLS